MAEPAWLTFLIDLVTDEGKHFLLAASVGALLFSLTSTTWYAGSSIVRRLFHLKVNTAVDFGMFISCLLVGLSFALASHWALDYVAVWYITPLGPSLNLIQ